MDFGKPRNPFYPNILFSDETVSIQNLAQDYWANSE
jgi:hypothetical protein